MIIDNWNFTKKSFAALQRIKSLINQGFASVANSIANRVFDVRKIFAIENRKNSTLTAIFIFYWGNGRHWFKRVCADCK